MTDMNAAVETSLALTRITHSHYSVAVGGASVGAVVHVPGRGWRPGLPERVLMGKCLHMGCGLSRDQAVAELVRLTA